MPAIDCGRSGPQLSVNCQHELIEKARNALFLGGPGDRLSNQRRDRNNSNVVGNPNRFGCLNCIGQNEFLQPRGRNARHRSA